MEPSCSVRGCQAEKGMLFKFPNPEKHLELFIGWVRATGDESLLGYHPLEIYYSMRVCQDHFKEEHYRDKSYKKPIPYLNLPEPIDMPEKWIVSMTKTDDIDYVETNQSAAHLESDIIETAGFIKLSYTTACNKNWYLFRNMFLVAPDFTDDEEERNNFSRLWSLPPENLLPSKAKKKKEKYKKVYRLNNIKKSVHYILTSPSDYYSLKFNYLLKSYMRTTRKNAELKREIRCLRKKVQTLEKFLFLKHI